MINERLIFFEAIINVIEIIKKSNNSVIFLQGNTGSGKSLILDVLKQELNVIDVTINFDEKRVLKNKNVEQLYYLSLIIKKILNYFIENKDLNEHLMFFERKIDNILNIINCEYMALKEDAFIENIENLSEELMQEFCNLLSKKVNLLDYLLIMDDFDIVRSHSDYQNYIYRELKKYFQTLYAINSVEGIIENIIKNSKIIRLDYSYKVSIVTEILDKYSCYNKMICYDDFSTRIRFILSEKNIKDLICKCNGNLNLMKEYIFIFYNIVKLNKEVLKIKIDNKLLNQIFYNILITPLETSSKLERTLNLN